MRQRWRRHTEYEHIWKLRHSENRKKRKGKRIERKEQLIWTNNEQSICNNSCIDRRWYFNKQLLNYHVLL